jgi:catechol 2,3-dioxygenase-like lactoylglutathione lyase family enzyme
VTLQTLDHFNIRTEKLPQTLDFYVGVLGLEQGFRPGVQDPRLGAWMYLGGRPVVHISAFDRHDPELMQKVNDHLGYRDPDTLLGSGAVDHLAFNAAGFDAMVARLEQQGVEFRKRLVDNGKLRQLFLVDPNGISIELNFRDGQDPDPAAR